MRLDKFLKVSRLIKRRTVAKDMVNGDKVKINDKIAKPGTEVKVNDIIEIEYGTRNLRVQVVEIKDIVPANEAGQLYKVLD